MKIITFELFLWAWLRREILHMVFFFNRTGQKTWKVCYSLVEFKLQQFIQFAGVMWESDFVIFCIFLSLCHVFLFFGLV